MRHPHAAQPSDLSRWIVIIPQSRFGEPVLGALSVKATVPESSAPSALRLALQLKWGENSERIPFRAALTILRAMLGRVAVPTVNNVVCGTQG